MSKLKELLSKNKMEESVISDLKDIQQTIQKPTDWKNWNKVMQDSKVQKLIKELRDTLLDKLEIEYK